MEQNSKKKYESLTHGLGITGLVLGIVTLLVSFIPCFGAFAIFFGVVALTITLIALGIASKHDHKKGLIMAALITALLGCLISYWQISAMNSVGTHHLEELKSQQYRLDQ